MTHEEIYDKFDAIGCLSFSTWTGSGIESRIAHFFAFDDEGFYLRTMQTKPFYDQLRAHKHLSVCGMYPQTQVEHDENNLPYFEPGYTIRMSGMVRELSQKQIEKKAITDENFNVAMHDIKKYPKTRIFVLYKGTGEYYDFDFAMETRDHKLYRKSFAIGEAEVIPAGLVITGDCIACGACKRSCTFHAIQTGRPYRILKERCDECGNCVSVCPRDAIRLRNE